jgi:hypothetical protein
MDHEQALMPVPIRLQHQEQGITNERTTWAWFISLDEVAGDGFFVSFGF